MSEKKMKFKSVGRVSDQPKNPAPRKLATLKISGGEATEAGNNFDKAIARKQRHADADLAPISGAGQRGTLVSDVKIKKNGISNYIGEIKHPKLGSVAEQKSYAAHSRRGGND